ncbi:MAG: hypothetical protein IPI45_11770 [Saprospiraceae bacterium]|nr:hypothetical protein [Saprospiraceae bacterium]MBK7738441.1 hypothetical protein [Saprospiraceae bacterium]MBK7912988.1 hypothetical protein [Saprospiraceae bacterium]
MIEEDGGVLAAFKYLILLSVSSKQDNSSDFLSEQGITLPTDFNLFDLSLSIKEFVGKEQDSKEYSAFAIQSMIDTVCEWSKKNELQQTLIFDSNKNSFDAWKNAADGSGFCELSRIFFSKFTERYLKYFLEREASTSIKSLYDRELFLEKLENHVQDISKHAFETAKIIQSLSAGWFNKRAMDKIPSEKEVKGFLSFAFQKINSELIREENIG